MQNVSGFFMKTKSEISLFRQVSILVSAVLICLLCIAIYYDNKHPENTHPDLSIDTTHYWYPDDLHLVQNADSLAEMVAIRIYTNPNYTKHKQINPKQLDSLQRLRLMLITKE